MQHDPGSKWLRAYLNELDLDRGRVFWLLNECFLKSKSTSYCGDTTNISASAGVCFLSTARCHGTLARGYCEELEETDDDVYRFYLGFASEEENCYPRCLAEVFVVQTPELWA